MRCHYEVFELARNATIEEIKKQYKKLALKYHPDKNIGNEEAATQSFKEIQSSYAVLSDPHERKWYDDHRESILRGGDGTSAGSDSDFVDNPLINLWKYFNSGCYQGFEDDNPKSFYHIYGTLFQEIHTLDFKEQDSCPEIVLLGISTTSPAEINQFYSHWTNFVSILSFSWEDKFNTTEAPNRLVKRAMEKENKKLREVARKKYIETIRELATYVRRRDPRIAKMENEKKKREEEVAKQRLQSKLEEKEKKRLQREKWRNYQETDEDREAREKERKGVFLFANEDSTRDERRGKRIYDDHDDDDSVEEDQKDNGSDLNLKDDTSQKNDSIVIEKKEDVEAASATATLENDDQDGDEDDNEDYHIIRCEICRKDFKAESQLQQHLTSKAHKKKVQELNKKSKKKNGKGKEMTKKSLLETNCTQEVDDDVDDHDNDNDDEAEAEEEVIVSRGAVNDCDQEKIAGQFESKQTQNDDNDSDSDEDEILQRLTHKMKIHKEKQSQTNESESESESEAEVEVEAKIEAKIPTPTPTESEPEKTQQSNPSNGKKKTKSKSKTSASAENHQDIYPQEFDELLERDEKQSKVCKVCGYLASSNNKLFVHIQQTGHAAIKEIGKINDDTEKKKKKKQK